MKQKYLLLSMILLVILFSATSLFVFAATPNLELTPPTQSVTVGNQTNVNVVVENVTDLRGANITLNFDASKLQYVSSTDGSFIPSATLLEQSIDNTNGSVTLDIAGLGASAYASGSGTIMTVIFNRIATGNTNITFGATTLRDKDNITITHTKGNGCLMTSLIGDFNADGCVEFEDLMIFAMAYGSCEGDANWNPVCDLNSDGCIEFEDLMLFAMHYGLCDEPCPPPSAPTLSDPGISVDLGTPYDVCWSAVSGATSYKIQEATSSDFSSGLQEYPVTDICKTFSHNTAGTYYYRVAAVNDCGQSGWSNVVDMDVNEVCTSPPVSEVSALALTYHSTMSKIQSKIDKLIEAGDIHRSYPLVEPKRTTKGDVVYEIYVEWAGYTGADGYKVYRSVNGGSYILIAEGNVDPGYDYYSFWDASVTVGNTYSYYVTAYGTGWETCASQSASTTPLPSCSLISPTNGATISNPTPAFSWSPVGVSSYPYGAISSGESDLYVYDETAGSTSWWTYFTNMTTSSATYNQDGQAAALVSDHQYIWNSWAYGYDGSGKGIAVSASEDWGFDYGCTPPSPPNLSDPGSSLPSPATYTVSWSSVSGATYVLQEAISPDFSSGLQEFPVTSTSKSFSHTVSTPTTYYYRVAAVDSCGQSVWSNVEDIDIEIIITNVVTFTCDGQQPVTSDCNITLSH